MSQRELLKELICMRFNLVEILKQDWSDETRFELIQRLNKVLKELDRIEKENLCILN